MQTRYILALTFGVMACGAGAVSACSSNSSGSSTDAGTDVTQSEGGGNTEASTGDAAMDGPATDGATMDATDGAAKDGSTTDGDAAPIVESGADGEGGVTLPNLDASIDVALDGL